MPEHTDREIEGNRADIILTDKNMKCQLLDMTLPPEGNGSVKEAEKLSKYKDLEIEATSLC